MINVPENELFSAYLDGELTTEEQAQVEQLLATSPAARQLLDELRALSAGLQALPVQRLGEDLSERVLREAERRILAGQAGPRRLLPVEQQQGEPSRLRQFFRFRTFFWPALAAAVAVMFMLQQPPKPPERVAAVPATPRSLPSIQAADEASESYPQPDAKAVAGGSSAPASDAATAGAEMAIQPAAEMVLQETEQPDTPAVESLVVEEPTSVDASELAPTAMKAPEQGPAAVSEPAETPSVATLADAPQAASPSIESKSPMPAPSEESAEAVAPAESVAMEAETPAEAAAEEVEAEEPPVQLLIVRCDVAPSVFEQKVFDRLIADQDLAVVEMAPEAADDSDGAQEVELGDPAEVKTLFVDATLQQLASLMKELQSRPDEFQSVKTEANRALSPTASGTRIAAGRTLSSKAVGGSATIRLSPGGSTTGAVGSNVNTGTVSASPSTAGATLKTTPKVSGGIRLRSGIGIQTTPAKPNAAKKQSKPAPPTKFRIRFVLRSVETQSAGEESQAIEASSESPAVAPR